MKKIIETQQITYKGLITILIGVVSVIFSTAFAYVELRTNTLVAAQARQDERLKRIEEDILRIEGYILNTLNNDARQTASINAIISQLNQVQERITRQEERINNNLKKAANAAGN